MDVVTAAAVILTLIFMSNFKHVTRDVFSIFPLRHEIMNYY